MTFVNPLFEAIEVFVELAEPVEVESETEGASAGAGAGNDHAIPGSALVDAATSAAGELMHAEREATTAVQANMEAKPKSERRHWQASMPATSFPMNAYAEAWEYEADEEDEGGTSGKGREGSRLPVGVLAQKFNRTVVQMDLVTGREASGPIRVSWCSYWLRARPSCQIGLLASEPAGQRASAPRSGIAFCCVRGNVQLEQHSTDPNTRMAPKLDSR